MTDDLMMDTLSRAKALGIPFMVMMKIDHEEQHSIKYWRQELTSSQRIEPSLTMVEMMTQLADVIAPPATGLGLSKGGKR